MSRPSLIVHVKSSVLIVPSKDINFSVFHQTNTKTIIKEALREKKSQGRATDEKLVVAITNMTVFYSSETPQSTSDQPYALDQIKCGGVSSDEEE